MTSSSALVLQDYMCSYLSRALDHWTVVRHLCLLWMLTLDLILLPLLVIAKHLVSQKLPRVTLNFESNQEGSFQFISCNICALFWCANMNTFHWPTLRSNIMYNMIYLGFWNIVNVFHTLAIVDNKLMGKWDLIFSISNIWQYYYSLKWRWIVVDIDRPSREVARWNIHHFHRHWGE